MKKLFLLICVLIVLNSALFCEDILNPKSGGVFHIYAGFDVDPMFAITAGIAKCIRLNAIDRDLQLSADISLPIFLADLAHFEINASAKILLADIAFLSIVNRSGIFCLNTENDLFGAFSAGIKESISVGYFSDTCFAAAEAEYDKCLVSHIVNSELYKDLVYPDAVDGWYFASAGRFKFGAQAGITLFGCWTLAARGGYQLSERLQKLTVPFYFNIYSSYTF